MILSVLIPSRRRPERLLKAVASIWNSCGGDGEIEFIIRAADDDPKTKDAAMACSILTHGAARLISDPRNEFKSLPLFYNDTLAEAKGDWCWIMNDDVVVSGEDMRWIHWLAETSKTGYLYQPEINRLGGSTYKKDSMGPFPIFPRVVINEIYKGCLPWPVDVGLYQDLIVTKGWVMCYLKGVEVWHQRDSDDVIEEHRRT